MAGGQPEPLPRPGLDPADLVTGQPIVLQGEPLPHTTKELIAVNDGNPTGPSAGR